MNRLRSDNSNATLVEIGMCPATGDGVIWFSNSFLSEVSTASPHGSRGISHAAHIILAELASLTANPDIQKQYGFLGDHITEALP